MKKLYTTPAVKFVTALFLLFSCSKVEKEAFVELPSYLQLPSSADVRLRPLIDSIWHYEHHRPVIGSIVSTYGFMRWDKSLIGYRGKTLVAVIPLLLTSGTAISGFIAFEMDERVRFKFYHASLDGRSRSVTNVVNALNFKVFGTSLARIDDPCAMSLRERELFGQARSANPGKKIQLNVRTIEVTTCYSWVSCIGDGEGNCVSNIIHHSDCITSVIWTPDWYYEETWGTSAEQDLSGDGGSGGGYSSEPCGGEVGDEGMEGYVVYEPERPIDDVVEYLRCFVVSLRARITFYADQPINGSNVKFDKYEKAGHTFLTIEQFVNGNIIRRTLGFHPGNIINPLFKTRAPSVLGDDSNKIYDVKFTADINGMQLASILGIIREFHSIYDLEKYNCTNFVLDVSDAAGLGISRSIGWWGIGSGLNPTSFGEDLKKLQGSIIEEGTAPANIGNCN